MGLRFSSKVDKTSPASYTPAMNKTRGKVGTSGREIAAALYGNGGRPKNHLEENREADNAHLGRVAAAARNQFDEAPRPFVAPAAPAPRLAESPKTSAKWAAARAKWAAARAKNPTV